MNRRDFLAGSLTGLTVGAGSSLVMDRALDSAEDDSAKKRSKLAKLSYAQQGEDLVLKNVFAQLHIDQPSYVDIGAWDPVVDSNTYLFYVAGSRGLLVEPNPTLCDKLRAARPGDAVVNAGVGVSDQASVDYFVMRGDGQLNTFSKEQADELVKRQGPGALERVMKLPLVNVNALLAQHFETAPNLFSIDVEGMDLDILKTLDFEKFRPQVFCVETSLLSGQVNPDILSFMASKGYDVRGGSFVNTVFLDHRTPPH